MTNNKRLGYILLGLFLLISSWQYLFSRHIKLNWTYKEAYLMRFQWLDSINLYLHTGKILMSPENMRLEDLCVGEDQGYPLILSLIGKFMGMSRMAFDTFIKFNYLLL